MRELLVALRHDAKGADHPACPPSPAFEELAWASDGVQLGGRLSHAAVGLSCYITLHARFDGVLESG